MGCLLAMFAGIFPRFALVVVMLVRPQMVNAAFETWIWPLLGLVFLPLTTLMYLILWRAGGLEAWDWFWLALAAALDIGHWGASYTQRNQMPGYPTRTGV